MVTKSGYSEDELHKFIASKAERYKLPQRYVALDELPCNRMQKIDRKVLKKIWDNPKVIILVSNDTRNTNGCQDASCAVENMLLAAHLYGLGAVWLNPLRTLRDVEPVKDVLDSFNVPAGHTVWSAMALGYPAGDGAALKKKGECG